MTDLALALISGGAAAGSAEGALVATAMALCAPNTSPAVLNRLSRSASRRIGKGQAWTMICFHIHERLDVFLSDGKEIPRC
jgi:hypothetical protein